MVQYNLHEQTQRWEQQDENTNPKWSIVAFLRVVHHCVWLIVSAEENFGRLFWRSCVKKEQKSVIISERTLSSIPTWKQSVKKSKFSGIDMGVNRCNIDFNIDI